MRRQQPATWGCNSVLRSFQARIAQSPYLLTVTALYYQFTTGAGDLSAHSSHPSVAPTASVHCCGYTLTTRVHSLFTDDLVGEQNLWSVFVHNNEFVGLFFNRKPSMKRVFRVPILAVTFLGPMLSYAINFDNMNAERLAGFATIVVVNNGQFWDDSGWVAAFVLFAVFTVISFGTEKLIVYIVPEYAEVTRAEAYFPVHSTPVSKVLSKANKVVLARCTPFLICAYFIVHTSLLVKRMDTSDAILVLEKTLENFCIGVGVFFVIGWAFAAAYGVRWSEEWPWKTAGRCLCVGVRDVLWTPVKNIAKTGYEVLNSDEY